MKRETWVAVDHYYLNLLSKPDPRFEGILQSSREAGLPPINITASQGCFLEILVRALGAKRILEIGTLGGYSTAWLAKGLPPDGQLISLEKNPEHAALAQKNLDPFEFTNLIKIQIGDALEILKNLKESRGAPFDLIFIDAEKAQYSDYLEQSILLSRQGTLIIADNVVKHGRIVNQAIDTPSRMGITAFHQKVSTDPRLRTSVLQTVGEKGHDGFAFMVVDLEAE